jgi:hypothetical protein
MESFHMDYLSKVNKDPVASNARIDQDVYVTNHYLETTKTFHGVKDYPRGFNHDDTINLLDFDPHVLPLDIPKYILV